MPSFTREIVIDRSPQTVFAVLDDLEQAKLYMPIKKIEVLTPGRPMGVGFKWRETRRIFGFIPFKIPLAITGHDKPNHWRLSYNDGKVEMNAWFDLTKKGAGTHVHFTEEAEPLTLSAKKTQKLLARMEKQDHDLLERLKAHVEATTPAPSAAATKKAAVKKAPAKGKAKKAR